MLTARGFWFLLAILLLLGVAAVNTLTTALLLALTLLVWFLAQWLLFQWQVARCRTSVKLSRSLHTPRGDVASLWAGQRAEVRLSLSAPLVLPAVTLRERVPGPARARSEVRPAVGAVTPDSPLELAYDIVCPAPGRLRFEGVLLHLSDVQGFFAADCFVRDPREYRILPALAVEAGHPTFVKQHNALPLLGKHRHARPGSGSELLDLRDYLPGDPPKLIAWKASARRNRLMTKEFESEVPIRCTLLLDASTSVRLGPAGATALTRLVEISAAVAQAATAERDLIGLCIFDERGVRRLLRPGRGPQHWLRLLELLTATACLLPETTKAELSDLLPHAYDLAQQVYPELLAADLNAMPWWLPLWSPQPRWSQRTPRRGGLWRRLGRWWRSWRLSPAHHRLYRWRKQLAALLSVRYGLDPGGLALLLEDDEACSGYLQRFLAEHQVAFPHPLYDEQGHYLFRSPQKIAAAARALLAAVSRGKDNELFVLCADLLEAGPELVRLERAVCVARARHHQVVVICTWPATLPPPPPFSREPPARATAVRAGDARLDDNLDLHALVQQASAARLQQAFARLRHVFGRLGVTVLCAAERDTVDRILQRLQKLRGRGRGVR